MADTVWSQDQVRIALTAVRNRLMNNKNAFNVKVEGERMTFSCHKDAGNSIYISIDEYRIYLSLADHTGSFSLKESWFWQHKEIKQLVKDLKALAAISGVTTGEILVKCFPEVVTTEFEKHILGVKDGKSEST